MNTFKNILLGTDNLFLSFTNCGGMNFWGVFLFFLASPFSFLVILVDAAHMSLFMNVLIALKMAVCAFTAGLCLQVKLPALSTYLRVLLSVMYAFSGYSMLYYQNVMWLDVMYLFPLLLLALERLIFRQRAGAYIAVLVAMLAVQFYLSYMVVLFIALWMGIQLFSNKCMPVHPITPLFCAASVIAALLSAPCWLPALLQYFDSARGVGLVQSLSTSSFFTPIFTTLPLLLCSGILIAALYTARKSLCRKDFRIYTLLLFLTIIAFEVEPINKMWHLGSYQAFPSRYGYMASFFTILLFANALEYVSPQPVPGNKKYVPCSIVFVVLLCAGATVTLFCNYEKAKAYTSTLWGDAASFLVLLGIFILLGAGYLIVCRGIQSKRLGKCVAGALVTLLLLTECTLNFTTYFIMPSHSTEPYQTVMDLSDRIEDDSFYRVKMDSKLFDVNLVGAMEYGSLAHYSSLTAQDYMFTMKKLGYSSYWMEVGSHGGTLFSDALLSNKYIISNNTGYAGSIYENGAYCIRQNPYALSPLLLTSTDILAQGELLLNIDRPLTQQRLAEALFGETAAGLFTRYDYTSLQNIIDTFDGRHAIQTSAGGGTLRYDLHISDRQTLYFDCFDRLSNALVEHINGTADVSVNGVKLCREYPSKSLNGLLCLGTFENEDVSIEVHVNKSVTCASFGVYGMHMNILDNLMQAVRMCTFDQNSLSTSCIAQKGDALFFALPYDDGYTIYVNGKATTPYKVFSGFMAIELEEGINNIALSFIPRGMKAGLYLAVLGALLLWPLSKAKRFIFSSHFTSVCAFSMRLLFIVVLICVYILPVFICMF